MRLDLSSQANDLLFALFDPAAIRNAKSLSTKALEREAEVGNCILLHTDDFGCTLRVFVDEDLDPSLAVRAKKVLSESLLLIPAGQLVLAAHDELQPVAMVPTRIRPSTVPPGSYLADVYSIDGNADSDHFKAALGPDDYPRWLFGRQAQKGGCLVGVISFGVLALAGHTGIPRLQWVALAMAILGAIAFNLRWTRKQRRLRASYAAAEEAWAKQYPLGAIVLRALPEPFRGAGTGVTAFL